MAHQVTRKALRTPVKASARHPALPRPAGAAAVERPAAFQARPPAGSASGGGHLLSGSAAFAPAPGRPPSTVGSRPGFAPASTLQRAPLAVLSGGPPPLWPPQSRLPSLGRGGGRVAAHRLAALLPTAVLSDTGSASSSRGDREKLL